MIWYLYHFDIILAFKRRTSLLAAWPVKLATDSWSVELTAQVA
jgi:hypothetical protein